MVAVNCDDDANKQLCGAQGVQGFPTLKTFRPGKKAGKPVVEDYRGPRTASGITDEVVNKINNHVAKLTDKDVDAFVAKEEPKAILFTEKGTTSALLRSIAIDFLDVIKVGQIRNKEKAAVERFGIEKYPTLVLIPGGANAEPVVYDGELKKKDMVEFLKRAGEPNPDPTPAKGKKDKAKGDKKPQNKAEEEEPKVEKPKTAEPEPEESPKSSSSSSGSTAQNPASTMIPITPITSDDMLQENCLQPKSHTCVLAIVPSEASEQGDQAVDSLSKLNAKYIHGKRHLFPFYSLPHSVESEIGLRKALDLTGEVELIAINVRRSWWRHYEGDFSLDSVEAWIDAIRMGEGDKKPLFQEMIFETPQGETLAGEHSSEGTKATEPEPVETKVPKADDDEDIVHGEL